MAVRYRYEWDGVTHTGQRAAIHERPDNFGSFQKQLSLRLISAQRAGTPVLVWVNPARPAESMADRSLRPGLVGLALGFAVLLGGIALLGLAPVVLKVRGGLRAADLG